MTPDRLSTWRELARICLYDEPELHRMARAIGDACDAIEALQAERDRLRKDLTWIAGIPQDSIIEVPEVWGAVLAIAREALRHGEEAPGG